ncbi:hypothetical protein MCEMIEM13_01502 [Comamonadaceae bacterium]
MCIVQTHRHESAVIKSKPVGKHGLVQVDYFGMFTDAAAATLVKRAREECERAPVHIARFDRAVITCNVKAVASKGFKGSLAPGAMVCRPDQYEGIAAMCSALSAAGALRLVFLDYSEALDWAEHLAAGLMRHGLRQMPGRKHPIEEQDRLLVVCQKDKPANQQMANRLAGR